MYRILIIFVLVSLFGAFNSIGQTLVDITLQQTPANGGLACFNLSIKSGDNKDISLAGQNYRIFYDSEKLDFLEDKTAYTFDPRAYGKVYIQNTETKGIGFLSLSLDGRKLTDKTIKLVSGSSWSPVMNVCFKETSDTPYDLTWAHRSRTSKFASAEVALSEWISEDRQQVLKVNEIIDFNSVDDTTNKLGIHLNVFPNPVIDYINVEIKGSKDIHQIIIKDIIGREVVFDHVSGEQTSSYDLINWPEGTYTVELLNEDNERVTATKVIKINSF